MKRISVFIIFFCSQLCFSGEIENRIIKELQLKLPNYSFDSVKKSSIPNLYQVTTGASIFYVTKDVKFIFDGNILESKFDKNKNHFFVNHTEIAANKARSALLNKIDESKLFIYGANNNKHVITVITDIDCPWCVKFHNEIKYYVSEKIKIRYGVHVRNDKAMKKVISAWCSSDRNKSFSSLKQGKKIKTLECENPINEHKDMINLIGVRPTPAIFLQNGEAISGYKPYDEILAILREKN